MAYEWKDGEVITAEKLNSTGGGVLIVTATFDSDKELNVMDKTFGELYNAFTNGITILVANIYEQKKQDDEQAVRYYGEQYDLVRNFAVNYSADDGDNWYGTVGDYNVTDCKTREELMNSYPFSS